MNHPREDERKDRFGTHWRDADASELMDGMQRGSESAYAEFFRRYLPSLLALARRRAVDRAEALTLATEFLDDVALKIGQTRQLLPRALAAYLATGFRRHLAFRWRTESRRAARRELMLGDIGGGSQRAVAEACSEYAIALAAGPLHDADESTGRESLAREVRARLAAALLEDLGEDDLQVLGWLRDRCPQREIAALAGTTPGAMRVRIMRLRQRLVRAALRHIETLPPEESQALSRLVTSPRARGMRGLGVIDGGQRSSTGRRREGADHG